MYVFLYVDAKLYSFRCMPKNDIVELHSSSNFSFLSILTSVVAMPIFIPSSHLEKFLFPISSPMFDIICFLDDSYSD